MHIILAPLKWRRALVSIEDVVIFPKTPEEHLSHVESISPLVSQAEMTLEFNECFFFSDASDYLDQIIAPRRLHIATKTIDDVRDFEYPTATFKLRSLLELCNVYRRFVPNLSRMAVSSNKRLRKGELTTFGLNDKERQTVEDLKKN